MTSPLSNFKDLLDTGAVEEYATWCSFCNAEEASGELTVELNPGEPVDLPIGPTCLEQAVAEGFDVRIDPVSQT